MKKFLLGMIMLLASFSGIHAEHLKFMGTPIDGTREQFSKKLQSLGFTMQEESDDDDLTMDFYRGNFMNENVLVGAQHTLKSNKICGVTICFDQWEGNPELLYKDLENSLIRKYDVTDFIEEEGYFRVFKVNDKGVISYDIKNDFVTVSYYDKENTMLYKAEGEEDL